MNFKSSKKYLNMDGKFQEKVVFQFQKPILVDFFQLISSF